MMRVEWDGPGKERPSRVGVVLKSHRHCSRKVPVGVGGSRGFGREYLVLQWLRGYTARERIAFQRANDDSLDVVIGDRARRPRPQLVVQTIDPVLDKTGARLANGSRCTCGGRPRSLSKRNSG